MYNLYRDNPDNNGSRSIKITILLPDKIKGLAASKTKEQSGILCFPIREHNITHGVSLPENEIK